MDTTISVRLKIRRQSFSETKGHFECYELKNLDVDMSFLEMLDLLNETLIKKGSDPVAFDHDCREGICGACGAMVNGEAHGFLKKTTLCQLHMRHFNDGELIVIEPWSSPSFPVIKDLVVDRSSFDRIIASGGYVSVKTGSAPEANSTLVPKEQSEKATDSASCIGCGACVASCPNGSAMLFVGAKVSQMVSLPQGQIERKQRVKNMVSQMDKEGFGHCSNTYACEVACPKAISVENISDMNREFLKTKIQDFFS